MSVFGVSQHIRTWRGSQISKHCVYRYCCCHRQPHIWRLCVYVSVCHSYRIVSSHFLHFCRQYADAVRIYIHIFRRHEQTMPNTKITQKSISIVIITVAVVVVCAHRICMFLFVRWKYVFEYDDDGDDDGGDVDSRITTLQSFDSVPKVSRMLSHVYRFYDTKNKICKLNGEEAMERVGGSTKRQTILYDNTQWWMINDENSELLFTSVRVSCFFSSIHRQHCAPCAWMYGSFAKGKGRQKTRSRFTYAYGDVEEWEMCASGIT